MSPFVIPAFLAAAGLAAGMTAGLILRPEVMDSDAHLSEGAPAQDADANPAEQTTEHGAAPAYSGDGHGAQSTEFIKLNNQFVVPVLKQGRVTAMVVLSLTLEATEGSRDQIYEREPRIRDAFLRILFDHANSGGFDGTYTSGSNLNHLRSALREASAQMFGEIVVDVLVTDIARQDV